MIRVFRLGTSLISTAGWITARAAEMAIMCKESWNMTSSICYIRVLTGFQAVKMGGASRRSEHDIFRQNAG